MYYQLPLICEVCGNNIANDISSFWTIDVIKERAFGRNAVSCVECENLAVKFIIMGLLGMAQPISQLEGARLESQPLALGDSNP
jgi:hypothetical protein